MEALLLTILGDIIAGVAVHGITQGFSQSEGNQTVIIERAVFNIPEFRLPSRSSNSNDEIWMWVFGILAVFAAVILALVGLSAVYAQNINLILEIGFWATMGMSVIGGLLLMVGIFQGTQSKDWSIAQVAGYSLALCLAVGGLVWLIYAPPKAPAGYDEMLTALQNLNLQDEHWTSRAIEIGMGRELFTINPVIKFIALQAIGILPMLITIFLGIYIQASLAMAIFRKGKGDFSIYALVGAPALAFLSALFLGVFG